MDTSSVLSGLNETQKAAVLHRGAPLLILAGAGSGKTRVITIKIAHLIAQGVDPRSILAVTFTNKAANEMRERAAQLHPGASQAMIRTFHSFGAWLLRRNAAAVGLPREFSIYDDDDQVSLLGTLYPQYTKQVVKGYARAISRAKDFGLTPEDDLSPVGSDSEFPQIYRTYTDNLRKIGNVDFGDLILLPQQLLAGNAAIGGRIRDRFRIVLVDEYQDSNIAQYKLLQSLTDSYSYVCVVGDDDQSIYRFRGAEVRNIIDFPEHFPGTDIVRLEQNYRSTGSILQVAHAVVSRNQGRLGKQLWTENPDGSPPVIAHLFDQDQEVEYCTEVLMQGSPGETAILYRTNAQSRAFETAFLRGGIPYRIVGTLRFYEREEVKDAIALLRFTANPRDPISLARIINKPARGIGKKSVEKILERAGDGDLLQAMRAAIPHLTTRSGGAVEKCRGMLQDIIGDLGAGKHELLSDLLHAALMASGLWQYHREQDEVAGLQKIQNLEELENAAGMYPATTDGLIEFLEAIELDSGAQQDAGEDAVTLITMHNTKGLEFDRVIITGMDEGIFPRESDLDPDSLEEERRLFYVAVTRARKELHMTTTRMRRVHGRIVDTSPSRFLYEIPRDLVEFAGAYSPGHGSPAGGSFGSPGGSPAGSDPAAADNSPYPRGCGVYHDDYGSGRVVRSDIKDGELVVLVQFETGRTARFLPAYSPLERISIDD
ncbi:ATP-dependent helicase [Spirochaeta africana]|uniref:DNA 3'-5' helicase n=1 Tax=Spirochaeta africana (strain ATCC 700263 / DSM 8902 / Z-7692) TaxID=889378 RepID=H9UGW5_SPIAZ|nr:UvrD-helicase domain-containing protein [Spirochaeta africana]AFG36758.1 DNA/RNA helicase, superfamily I [Spirochaeta africana DSM 8902]